MQYLTLTTDGSYCDTDGSGGYGFAISHEGRFYPVYGKIRNPIDCMDCELKAIVNGLSYVSGRGELFGLVDRIIVNTDQKHADAHLLGMKKKVKYTPVRLEYQRIVSTFGWKVEFRHVKSHSKIQDARSKVNRTVDKLANKGRKLKK